MKLLAGVKPRRASWRTEGSPGECQLGREMAVSSLSAIPYPTAYNGAAIPKTIPTYGMKLRRASVDGAVF